MWQKNAWVVNGASPAGSALWLAQPCGACRLGLFSKPSFCFRLRLGSCISDALPDVACSKRVECVSRPRRVVCSWNAGTPEDIRPTLHAALASSSRRRWHPVVNTKTGVGGGTRVLGHFSQPALHTRSCAMNDRCSSRPSSKRAAQGNDRGDATRSKIETWVRVSRAPLRDKHCVTRHPQLQLPEQNI